MVDKRELKTFDDKMIVGTVAVEHKVSQDDINTVICGWIESGYSCLIASSVKNGFKDSAEYETMFWSDWATDKILNGDSLIVKDTEENETHELTLEKLINGIKLNATERSHDDFFNDNHDAITYDCIMQYAIFGELIYG
ncbi:hypothetical protein NSQ62_08050 [Solibacillus sp. FSL H8-0523]|uniref:hypothetical protein n=1 Tax=Solibacillus sp. FSL H8-0523 TaxID=2954511 RepID=UPI003100B7CE